MYWKVRLLIPILIVLLSGCHILQSTQIEIIRPAKISLPQTVRKVALINNSIYNHTLAKEDEFKNSLIILDSLSSERLVALVADEMHNSPRFDSIALIHDSKLRSIKEVLNPIKPDVIAYQIEKHKVEAILSLEAISLEDTILRYSYFDGYSTVNRYGFGLHVTSFWRLYNKDSVDYFTEKIFKDTLLLSEIENIKHFSKIVTKKDGREWLAENIMNQHFFSISDHIAPYWSQVPRYFYYNVNMDMQLATKHALNDEWIKAAIIWKEYTESSKVKLASSACYNMALVCEIQGKLDLAQVWINKSINLFPNYTNKEYKQTLDKRLEEEKQLNKQFGIIN